ncbi:hypothetical protein Scep_009121 [Stephania cephalantha]|uniref:Uncharacterized protein n=1 Tax=Stephania cephalantha TaxID=152367 RepID=A0AAP0JUW3_9MAGN
MPGIQGRLMGSIGILGFGNGTVGTTTGGLGSGTGRTGMNGTLGCGKKLGTGMNGLNQLKPSLLEGKAASTTTMRRSIVDEMVILGAIVLVTWLKYY